MCILTTCLHCYLQLHENRGDREVQEPQRPLAEILAERQKAKEEEAAERLRLMKQGRRLELVAVFRTRHLGLGRFCAAPDSLAYGEFANRVVLRVALGLLQQVCWVP